IACAQYLVDRKYTNSSKLALCGETGGSLLVTALMTQRPDLCRVILCGDGGYDALRFDRDQRSFLFMARFGAATDPMQFKSLYAFSPYHRVRDGVTYPSVLLKCRADDTSSVASDSWKMAARLQAARSTRPVLLHTFGHALHGYDPERSAIFLPVEE